MDMKDLQPDVDPQETQEWLEALDAVLKVEGVAVDTHVKRLANRLGFSEETDPDKIEQDLMRLIPKERWFDFTYVLIDHGRAVCVARKPRCEACPVNHFCPSSLV